MQQSMAEDLGDLQSQVSTKAWAYAGAVYKFGDEKAGEELGKLAMMSMDIEQMLLSYIPIRFGSSDRQEEPKASPEAHPGI